MKQISFLLILALLALTNQAFAQGKAPVIPIPGGNVRAGAPKAGNAPKIQIGKAETFKLDNGLQVIVVENHKLPKVSYRVFVDSDPVLEKDAAGYIDMMGELLAKGTKTRTKAQIDEEVDFIGASLSTDGNGVIGQALSKHADKLLTLMSDVLLNPAFPADELEKARKRTMSGLQANKDDANAIAANVSTILRNTKNHPYGEVMTEESLAKVTLDQVTNYYNTYFKPNKAYLVIVGDITRARGEALAKQYFGAWKRGDVPAHTYDVPQAPQKSQVDFVHKPGAVQSVINITYPIPMRPGDPDAIPARVMNALFGGYFNSRVNANLREGHGWTYGARSTLSPDKLVGAFTASASVRNAVTDSSIIEFQKEMRRLLTEKVNEQELSVVKNVLTGQFGQSLEEPGTIANFALNIARYGLAPDYYEKYLQTLQAVTPEQVMAMAQKYIRPDNAHILVVGNKDDVADRLKQFSPEGKINFYDIYGNPVNYNAVSIPAGVTPQTIIEDYIRALGGQATIAGIKDMYSAMTMETGGPVLSIKNYQKGNDRLVTEMSMNGQVMQKRVYDGKMATESGMGAPKRTLEGEDLVETMEQAMFVKEASYGARNYKLTLKGAEAVNGKNAYVIEVARPGGRTSTEYYDMTTSLKVREVTTQEGQDGNPVTVVTDFADYKAVNGFQYPHTVTISGVFPVPLKAVVSEVKINSGIDDSMFK
jgi:zinc protease